MRTLAGAGEGKDHFYNKETQVLVEPRDTHTHTHTCPGYGWYDGVVFILWVLVAETQFYDFVVGLGLSEVTEG